MGTWLELAKIPSGSRNDILSYGTLVRSSSFNSVYYGIDSNFDGNVYYTITMDGYQCFASKQGNTTCYWAISADTSHGEHTSGTFKENLGCYGHANQINPTEPFVGDQFTNVEEAYSNLPFPLAKHVQIPVQWQKGGHTYTDYFEITVN